ncbi:hypothetical protein II898_01120 [bacterium]|nr:hypothetical protein [bacterium]
MKKIILFFVMFLFLGILSAQEAQNEPAPSQSDIIVMHETTLDGGEAAPEEAEANQESEAQNTLKEEEKPDKFFFLPTIGAGSGYGVFNVNAGFWMNLLVNRTKSGNNTYLGIKTHVGYTPLDLGYNLIMFPIELNALIDFKVENEVLAYLGWWFSAGIGLSWELERYYYDEDENEFFKNMAWGTGLSLLFKNRVTFIAGINGNPRRYFDVNFAVGYRF